MGPTVGEVRQSPSGNLYRVTNITQGSHESFTGIEYTDAKLNNGHPFSRLWLTVAVQSDRVVEVAPKNRARVTAGPAWLRV